MPLTPSTLAVRALALALGFAMSFVGREQAFAAIQCTSIFEVSPSSAQLKLSVKDSIMVIAKFRIDIDLAQVRGTSTMVLKAMFEQFNKKETQLLNYLSQTQGMTRPQLAEKIREQVLEIQSQKDFNKDAEEIKKQEDSKRLSADYNTLQFSGMDATFGRVQPGKFRMGYYMGRIINRGAKVHHTRPIDMMSTLTTQDFWRKVVVLAEMKLPGKYLLTQEPSHFSGRHHPVESVTYFDIQIWLSALNELSKNGEPLLKEFIRHHQDGDIYRLPTDAEWEYIARAKGKYTYAYDEFYGKDTVKLDQYVWNKDNSRGKTHPVAEKLPLVVDGESFYDLLGNVHEWVNDWYEDSLSGGTDPIGPSNTGKRTFRNGSFDTVSTGFSAGRRDPAFPGSRDKDMGFRLVREQRP